MIRCAPLLLSTIVAIVISGVQASPEDSRRAFEPEDINRIERLETAVISPDGQWIAFERIRARNEARFHMRSYLYGRHRADVWIAPTAGGVARNLTNGASDDAGYWLPTWSPDSSRLAMLSTRGGNVRAWTWELSSDELTRLTDRAVALSYGTTRFLVWLSNRHLLVPVLPVGVSPAQFTVQVQGPQEAMARWPEAWKGKKATASVLDSGQLDSRPESFSGSLLVVDTVTGQSRVVAEGLYRDFRLSPGGTYVGALRVSGRVEPEASTALYMRPWERRELVVFRTKELLDSSEAQVKSIRTGARDVSSASIRWSQDERQVAVLQRSSDGSRLPLYRYTIDADKITGDETPVAHAQPASGFFFGPQGEFVARGVGEVGRQPEWLSISKVGTAQSLTRGTAFTPSRLVQLDSKLVGVFRDKLWSVRSGDGRVVDITPEGVNTVESLVWPTAKEEGSPQSGVIIQVKREARSEWLWVDAANGKARSVARPTDKARISDFNDATGVAVSLASTPRGSFLWKTQRGSSEAPLVAEVNGFLRQIKASSARHFSYKGLDGQELNAWILLPPDYQEGIRYPTVVHVYAGVILGDREPPRAFALNRDLFANYHALTGQGYAVLYPSIPLESTGQPSDPYAELSKGVLPAVNKAIDLGIADPERLAVMGHSYGGFSVLGLISQTNRFRAAIAVAPLADLVSLYGTFDARLRHLERPHQNLFRYGMYEGGQGRMGSEPWRDLQRYVRNSPLSYAHRVETPLMLVQGDLDYVPIQQSEQFFSALYRQNKRARFVRYFGEGHVLESPANIVDFWQRVFEWLDEHLMKPDE